MNDLISGPCCICGATNYPPSMGGPAICPKCDCGHFDAATVLQQAKVIDRMKTATEELERANTLLGNDNFQMRALLHKVLATERRKVKENRPPWFDALCSVLEETGHD